MYATAFSTEFYQPAGATTPPDSGAKHVWKNGSSFSFHDVLDTLNPLQHIPVVGTLYRWITGDEPGDMARAVGDGLYGGPIGFAAGAVAAAVKDQTGKDPGEMVMSLLTGKGDAPATLAGAAAPAAATPPTALATAAAPAARSATMPPVVAAAAAAPAASGSLTALFRSPPAAPVPDASSAQEENVRSQNAALQRRFHGGQLGQMQHPATAPVPLQLSGPQMPPRFARAPVGAPPSGTTPSGTAPAAAQPAGATPAAPLSDLSALPQNPTVDIPQRMMDALDKYAHMQQQREQRGQQLDVAP